MYFVNILQLSSPMTLLFHITLPVIITAVVLIQILQYRRNGHENKLAFFKKIYLHSMGFLFVLVGDGPIRRL